MNNSNICNMLNATSSSEYVLAVKTKAFHWNIVDPAFGPLHSLYGEQYDQLSGMIDAMAERCRQLGGVAFGSAAEFLKESVLKETPGKIVDAKESLSSLVKDHETMANQLRKSNNKLEDVDAATANMIQEWIAAHEKMAWFLRSHLG